MQKMPRHGIAILLTDSPTRNREIESEIVSYGEERDIDVMVVISPRWRGSLDKDGDPSWQLFNRVSQGRVFNMEKYESRQLFDNVSKVVLWGRRVLLVNTNS